jgi:hypothetical protein
MIRFKALWVSSEVHGKIKAAASLQGKKIGDYLRDVSERSEKELDTSKKWRIM